jgi:hypothetical protein
MERNPRIQLAGDRDHFGGEVDPEDGQTAFVEVATNLPGAAAKITDRIEQPDLLGEAVEQCAVKRFVGEFAEIEFGVDAGNPIVAARFRSRLGLGGPIDAAQPARWAVGAAVAVAAAVGRSGNAALGSGGAAWLDASPFVAADRADAEGPTARAACASRTATSAVCSISCRRRRRSSARTSRDSASTSRFRALPSFRSAR